MCLIVSILNCWAAGDKANNPSSLRKAFRHSKYSEVISKCWEENYAAFDAGKKLRSGVPYYPTEPGIELLSAWICTGNAKYREAAVLHFDFAHSRENEDHLLITELGFNRDTDARQIYNFYVAYKILGDKKYLEWADQGARALMIHLPRRHYTMLGTEKTYNLFVAGYCKSDKPYNTAKLDPWVDVNQNAELALVYTLLYFETKSTFYKSEIAKDIVTNEMEAGLAIQDAATGAIPIADTEYWNKKFDTLYGSYAMFSWTWLNTYWRNGEWQKHIERSAHWIASFQEVTGKPAKRYYPAESDQLEHVDLWCRIPGLWKIKSSPYKMIDSIFSSGGESRFLCAWGAPFAYYDVMGIPAGFYLGRAD